MGRVAVVTGASSGIGAEIARLLAARGDLCILLARRADRLEALAEEIGGEAEPCDVSDRAAVESVAARVLERHPQIDVLVNNAGDPGPDELPRRRPRGDRAADPDQLPRRHLVPPRLPAGPARRRAVGRREHRLGLGRRGRPAERPLLGLEARPARVLSHGRGRAAPRGDPRAHGEAGLHRDGGLSAEVAAGTRAAGGDPARGRRPRTFSARSRRAAARRRSRGSTGRSRHCRTRCRTSSPVSLVGCRKLPRIGTWSSKGNSRRSPT